MSSLQLIATAPMGLESVVAQELKQLGYVEQHVENGRVSFTGDLDAICRTNLWMRTTDRILVKLADFPARTFDELFEGVKAIDWPTWLPVDAQFPVEGRSLQSQLTSVPACQGIVKKAIVEKMKSVYHTEWFQETGARYVIEVNLLKDRALITLDTTGAGLHKRGYRKLVTEAPIKETMAAAIIQLSRWTGDRPLVDPFCGSGTFLIEAAMTAWKIAPGLRRSFNAEQWPIIGETRWQTAREEAYDALDDSQPLELYGYDIDGQAIAVAQAVTKAAGLSKEIKLAVAPVRKLKLQGEYGCLITNPPYGERLGEQKEAEIAIRELAPIFAAHPTWSAFVITSSKSFEHHFAQQATKRRKLFNGRLECQLYQMFGPLPPRKPSS
jgi:putative N6-adenine-specific DNA methylase